MRKFLTAGLLVTLLGSQFQVLPLYAQSVAELAAEKEQSVEILQAVDTAIDATVEKLDAKISSSQSKEKLQEKHEEISEYLEEVKQDIQNENNVEDIEEKVEEAKKVAVLKVVAGVTPTEDLENTIDETIATTTAEKEEILELAKDSLETQAGDYSIIVKTSYDEAKVKSRFKTFDETSQVTALYSVGAINYFEVFIREDSIFRQEMLEDIDAGILPENFLGIEIVLPEVFSVFTTDLTGENISQTWGIERYQTYNHLDEIQKHNTQQIKVGVVDTGVDYTHPDLQNTTNTNLDKDFVNEDNDAMDDQGHGTHVAGTIAATINGNGIIGVNPNAEIIPLKICTSSGFCPSYAVIRALEYAAEKDVDILNMSLGGRGNPADHAICAAIDAYTQNGGLVVAAAGNANIAANEFVPGGCSSSLAVAAIDETNRRASFSNYGSKVDVAAPGVNVYSTYPTNKGNYKQLSGTSMAAPHIAGLVSLMFEAEGNMTLSEVKNKLQSYPQEVTTDAAHKTIAKAVDVNALLASYTNEDNTETNTPEEENEEIEIQEEVEVTTEENIAEYIEDYVEPEEEYEPLPAPVHYPLDDLTLEDIDFDIQNIEEGNFIPGVFELNPTIDLSEVEINSDEETLEYANEDSQSFSIADENEDEEVDESTEAGVYERTLIPEIISNGPDYTKNSQIVLETNFSIPSSDGVEINTNDEEIEIEEVIESEQDSSQVIDASLFDDNLSTESEDTQIQEPEDIEVRAVPDPSTYVYHIADEENEVYSGSILDEELEAIDSISAEEYNALGGDDNIGIQRLYEAGCDIYVGQRCTIRTRRHYSGYNFHSTSSGVVNAYGSSRYAIIEGLEAGTTYVDLFVKNDGSKEHRINVVVREIPEVKDVNCEVVNGDECRIHFPELGGDSQLTFESTNKSRYLRPYYKADRKDVIIPTNRLGIQLGSFTVEAFHNGYKIANILVDIKPAVPEYECTLLVGDYCQVMLRHTGEYVFEHSTGSIVNGSTYKKWNYVNLTAENPGQELTYLKMGYTYTALIKTTVIAPEDLVIPVEKCELWELGSECEVEIISASRLNYTTSTGGVVNLEKRGNKLIVRSEKLGETKIYVKYGGLTIGEIDVTVGTQAKTYRCQLNIGKECDVYLGKYANSMRFEQSQAGLVDLYLGGYRGRDLYVKAKKEGTVKVYVWNNRYRHYHAQLEIIIKEPSHQSLRLLEGEKSNIQGLPKYFNYQEMKDGQPFGESLKDGVRRGDPQYIELDGAGVAGNNVIQYSIEGLRSGNASMHIYKAGFHMDYLLHMIDVEVIEAPIEAISFCETRVNGSCQITLRNIGTNKYTIEVSEAGYTQMTLKRDYLYMKGLKEGTFEILITNNETGVVVHRGNVLIEGKYNVHEPRPKTLLSETSFTLGVGDSKTINITQGNGATAYTVIATYPNIKVSQTSNSSFKITAEDASHKSSTIHFIDKEKLYSSAKVYLTVEGESSGSGGNTGGGSDTGSGSTGEGNEEEVNNVIDEIDLIFEEFNLSDSLNTSSQETEEGKKQAVEDGKFTPEIITKVNGIFEKLYSKLNEQYSLQQRISILSKLNARLEDRKTDNIQRNALISYITYSFKEKIEEYENELFRSEFNTPFKKKYAALYTVDAKILEANVVTQLVLKHGFKDLDNFEEQVGGVFSEDGLNFLIEKELISSDEYEKYSEYIPTVEGLLASLKEQGGMDELLKTYYPGQKGVDDGFKLATEDFLTGIITSLDPREIPQVLHGLWQGMSDVITGEYDLSNVEEGISDFYDLVINIDVIIEGLGEYKEAKYKTYVHTTLALAIIPIGKIKLLDKIKGRGDTNTISEIKAEKKKKEDSIENCLLGASEAIIISSKKKCPDYILNNRAPISSETFLKTGFTRTGKKYSGAEIFKDASGKYYYIDTFHKGRGAHIEVFDKTGKKHLGEANPITGIIDTSKIDPDKIIPKNLR